MINHPQVSKMVSLMVAALLIVADSAQAQNRSVGDLDDEGRTFLFDEPLEGVYSNYWSGLRVGGDGIGETDVHIRSDGKLPFEGVVTIFCGSGSGQSWKLGAAEAEYSVPADVISNARWAFCKP